METKTELLKEINELKLVAFMAKPDTAKEVKEYINKLIAKLEQD